MQYSADGSRLLTGLGCSPSLRNSADLAIVQSFGAKDNCAVDVALSADGETVATSDSNAGHVWDALMGIELQHFAYTGTAMAVDLSADARLFAEAESDGKGVSISIWNAKDGTLLHQILCTGCNIDAMRLSPDSRTLAVGLGNFSVILLDVVTGVTFRSLEEGLSQTLCITFSHDSEHVYAGTFYGAIEEWDVASGKMTRTFVGHPGSVSSVSLSSDGKLLASASNDNGVMIWSLATGQQLANLAVFVDGSWAVTDALGRYDASDPDSLDSHYWVTDNLRTIALGQLKNEYYTPGLLTKVLAGGRLPAVTGIDTVQLPPIVTLPEAYHPSAHALSVTLHDDGGGIGTMLVRVNE